MTQRTLKKGMRGADVTRSQAFLRESKLYAGALDGRAGPIWRAAVKMLQQYRMISADGRVGPQTRGVMHQCVSEGWTAGELWTFRGVSVYGHRHPRLGLIPAKRGRLSHFGGPDDVDDRKLGQALLGDDLADVRRFFPRLFDLGVLRNVGAIPDGMGLSWALNTAGGHYCAMRWDTRPDPHVDRVLAYTDRHLVGNVPTDYGPAPRWWFIRRRWDPKVFDSSKATLRELHLRTNQRAAYCWAGPDVYGPQT